MTDRIRWEPREAGRFIGFAGSMNVWVFQIQEVDPLDSSWLQGPLGLTSELRGQQTWRLNGSDPDELKATAGRWLSEFVSSLGATFPGEPAQQGGF